MKPTVIFFGAGASVHHGVPVMKDFLANIHEMKDAHRHLLDDQDCRAIDALTKAKDGLDPLLAKINFSAENIEEALAILEMKELTMANPKGGSTESESFANILRRVIARIVECNTIIGGPLARTSGYSHLAAGVKRLPSDLRSRISMLTFNYDVALEHAFESESLPIDYCLRGRREHLSVVLKLHGSVNWSQCRTCQSVYESSLGGSRVATHQYQDAQRISFRTAFSGRECCGMDLGESPLIVPPSWDKSRSRFTMKNIWKVAAEKLSDAKIVVFCGYSFPDSDSFMTSLLAVGLQGRTSIERVIVVDPSPGNIEKKLIRLKGSRMPAPEIHAIKFESREGKNLIQELVRPIA